MLSIFVLLGIGIGIIVGLFGMEGAVKNWSTAGTLKLIGTSIILASSLVFTIFSGFTSTSIILLIGLSLALTGDYFLSYLGTAEVFTYGMIAFMLGYLMLAISIVTTINFSTVFNNPTNNVVFSVLALLVITSGILTFLNLNTLNSTSFVPVVVYLFVQTFLALSAIITLNPYIIIGALCLYISDVVIAFNVFSTKINFGQYYQYIIMPTYYFGLAFASKGLLNI